MGYRGVSSVSFNVVYLLLQTYQKEISAKFYSRLVFNLLPDTALMLEAPWLKMLNLSVKLATTGFSKYALVTGDSEIFSGSLKNNIFSQFKQ